MTDPRHDEFEVFLRRRSILGGQDSTTPDKLEPPHDLDNIVLGKARQAIRATTALPLYRAPRWALPVALAATLLLTLSVALNVGLKFNARPAAAGSIATTPREPSQSVSSEASRESQSPTPAPSSPAAQVASPQVPANDAYSAPQRESLAAAAKRAAVGGADRPQDPQAWLRRIAALRAAGKTAQADAQLRQFRSAFPFFPVTTSTDPASASPK